MTAKAESFRLQGFAVDITIVNFAIINNGIVTIAAEHGLLAPFYIDNAQALVNQTILFMNEFTVFIRSTVNHGLAHQLQQFTVRQLMWIYDSSDTTHGLSSVVVTN